MGGGESPAPYHKGGAGSAGNNRLNKKKITK
jgi:hypothetical protein